MTTRWLTLGTIAIEAALLSLAIAGCASQQSAITKSDPDVSVGRSKSAKEIPPNSINPANEVEVPPSPQTSAYSQSVDVRGENILVQRPTSAKATRLPPTSALRSIRQVQFLPSETDASLAANALHRNEADPSEELPTLEPARSVTEQNHQHVPIDLSTALFVAGGDNPDVAFARQRISEAYAQSLAANAMWVPSLRAGRRYR